MGKLPRAPLQEVIFEIRWALDIDPANGQQLDMGYALAQGKLQEIVKAEFPHYQRKMPHGFPDQLFAYQTVGQYWTKPDAWPVLQLGPGIFTINAREVDYDWVETYYPLIKRALNWIYRAYDQDIRVNFASLRYIDSVKPADYGYEDKWQDFVKDHFNFSFVNDFSSSGALKMIRFDQVFELEDQSSLHIAMNSDKYRKTNDDALVWQTAVLKNDEFKEDTLFSWADKAHVITSNLFREMTKPNFYASFK